MSSGKSNAVLKIAEEVRAVLVDRFPKAFKGRKEQKVPLKIGIFEDVLAAAPDLNPKHVSIALQDYCFGPTYLDAIVAGADRVDLNGNPVDKVTDRSARAAFQQVSLVRKNRKLARQVRELREQLEAMKPPAKAKAA